MGELTRIGWTPQEIEQLRRLFPSMTTQAVAGLMRRREIDVRRKAYRLGLRKTPEHLTRLALQSHRG